MKALFILLLSFALSYVSAQETYSFKPYFAGRSYGSKECTFISKQLANQGTRLVLADKKDYKIKAKGYSIKSFCMYASVRGKAVEFSSSDDKLTPQMRSYIKQLPPKGQLIFAKIIIINESNQEIPFGGLYFKIKSVH